MYKILLCLKYLKTRYIALASIISVMLGVATMIVVNSVMAGFGGEMKDRIRGILADVVVESRSYDGAPYPTEMMKLIDKVAGDKIEAITPTVQGFGIMHFNVGGGMEPRPTTIVGIYPNEKAKVSPLAESLMNYQDIKENGQLLRAARYSLDKTPDWELHPEDLARRIKRAKANAWQPGMNSNSLFPSAPQTETAASESSAEEEIPPFEEESLATNEEQTETDSANEEALTLSLDLEDVESSFDEFEEQATEAELEPGALMNARVYVGSAMVSYIDPSTDKRRWLVNPGDDVTISTTTVGTPPKGTSFVATVADIFHCGMSEYDANLVFMNIEELQRHRGMLTQNGGELVNSFHIKLKNYDDAEAVVTALKTQLPAGQYMVSTWEDQQGALLQALAVESAILNVLLSLIIAVAGFGILAIFFMIVVEKTRDIGILKSLGASSQGVMSIFLAYGFSLGIVGSTVGTGLGLLFVYYINEISQFLEMLSGKPIFDDKIYYFDKIPTDISAMMVFWVSVGAICMAVLASILPARRAANLNPVEALRH